MTLAPPKAPMTVTISGATMPAHEAETDLLVQVMLPGASNLPEWLSDYTDAATPLTDGEHIAIQRTRHASFRARSVLLVALASTDYDAARRLGREVGNTFVGLSSFACAGLPGEGSDSGAAGFAVGLAEGRYRFDRYKSERQDAAARLLMLVTDEAEEFSRKLATLEHIEEAVRLARDLTNTPARDLTPQLLSEAAIREAEAAGATVQVFDESWLADEGFAGLCAVGAGSVNPPRLIEVSYRGSAVTGTSPVVLVGKGVTFDSGGLSLKQSTDMIEMKSDMAGAATALAVVTAIARLRPANVHVVALLAAAENLPGPGAMRPGDVITHRNGLSTEIVNTDCEGRLVMSDVLAWAAEGHPQAIIDIATLTYSTISALGMGITSILSNSSPLTASVKVAGDCVGDPYWELPLWSPYRKLIDSPIADLRNESTDQSSAGAITAALYLREFVGETPWAHLDIGGTAFLDEETDDLQSGATGCCVRSLVRTVLEYQPQTRHQEAHE